MAKATFSTPVGEVYGQSTALATTLAYGDIVAVRKGFKGLQFYCASAFKFLTTPKIGKVFVYDDSASAETGGAIAYSNFTNEAQDNSSSTYVSLGTMTSSDILYIGCVDTFLGLSINVTTANSASVTSADVEYWNGDVWTDVAGDSDGTKSTNILVQDGLYTWTLPADWKPTSVNGSVPLYYIRYKPAGTLTAGVTIEELIPINKAANYAYFPAAMTQELNYDEDLVGGLQFLAASGTPTVYVNHISYKG